MLLAARTPDSPEWSLWDDTVDVVDPFALFWPPHVPPNSERELEKKNSKGKIMKKIDVMAWIYYINVLLKMYYFFKSYCINMSKIDNFKDSDILVCLN